MPLKTCLDEQPSINLTPMIDIVFLLIIFFMVGTKFVEMERNMPVELPEVADAGTPAPEPEKRVINVYRDGRILLDRRFVTVDVLRAELRAARARNGQLGVIVRGDAQSDLQSVVSVLEACRQAGISEMGISVRLAQRQDLRR